jgi:hypothetical protein
MDRSAEPKRSVLDSMPCCAMAAARGRFDVVLVWASDRIARPGEALPRGAR